MPEAVAPIGRGRSRKRGQKKELIVVEEMDEEDNKAISLHAIKGMASSKIIKVEGRVHDSTLMVLIDSGSTHSFIDEGMTKKTYHGHYEFSVMPFSLMNHMF